MKTVQYSTLFLSDRDHRDHVFLQRIISLYNTVHSPKGSATWVNNELESDLLVVGKDTDADVLAILPSDVKVILSLNSDFRHEGYHVIYVDTPLKVNHLIDKLKAAESFLELLFNHVTCHASRARYPKKLKLVQWPAAEIIAEHAAYPVLSTLLSKRPMGFEELVSISKKSEEFCRGFVDLVVNAGFAEYISILPADNPHFHGSAFLGDDGADKRGLLDRIRDRLGIF